MRVVLILIAGFSLCSYALPTTAVQAGLNSFTDRFYDNGDGTITDSQLNLVWSQADNGADITWTAAESYCESLTLGGITDWRLPNVDELGSLYDLTYAWHLDCVYAPGDAHINPLFHLTCSYQWSTSAIGCQTSQHEIVRFIDDLTICHNDGSATAHRCLAVHGDSFTPTPAPARFEDHGDGTLTDTVTHLMWTKYDNGADIMWPDAASYAENLTLGGFTDWRLATITELESLYDPAQTWTLTCGTSQFTVHLDPIFHLSCYFQWSGSSDGCTEGWHIIQRFVDNTYSCHPDSAYDPNGAFHRCLAVRGQGTVPTPTPVRTATPTYIHSPTAVHTATPTYAHSPTPTPASTRFHDNGNGTVTDYQTHLIWTKYDNGADITWPDAASYADGLTLGGYSDWRLATITELEGLYDPNQTWTLTCGTAQNIVHLDPIFHLTCYFQWSSSNDGCPDGQHKIQRFLDNTYSCHYDNWYDPGGAYHRCLAVRGSGTPATATPAPSRTGTPTYHQTYTPPPNRFHDNGNGTITDTQTNLMWSKYDNGADITWPDAASYADGLTLGGYTDWRLATISELESLYDPSQSWSLTCGSYQFTVHLNPIFYLTCYFQWSSSNDDCPEGQHKIQRFVDNTYSCHPDNAYDPNGMYHRCLAVRDGGSPTATPTPGNYPVHVQLILPQSRFIPGDDFYLAAHTQAAESSYRCNLFVLLVIGDNMWFYPSWTPFSPPSFDIDYEQVTVSDEYRVIIAEFSWPFVPVETSGIHFVAACSDLRLADLVSNVEDVEWGYGL